MASLETRTVAWGGAWQSLFHDARRVQAAIVEHLERRGYRIAKCDEDRGQKPPRRVRHRVTRFPLGIASREAPIDRNVKPVCYLSQPVNVERAEARVFKVDSATAAKPNA